MEVPLYIIHEGYNHYRETLCVISIQHYASRSGHVTVCQLLLSSGASANSQTPGGVTPLHRAAYCGREEVVRVLLTGGADVKLVDSDGRTPLHKVRLCPLSKFASEKPVSIDVYALSFP